jgi:hypothetical protein
MADTALEEEVKMFAADLTAPLRDAVARGATRPPAKIRLWTVYGWGRYHRQVSQLPPDQRRALIEVGEAIKQSFQPRRVAVRGVRVEGHADYDTPRNLQRERQVSLERAEAVATWLKAYVGPRIAGGISCEIRGFGATRLKAALTGESNRRQNRRVEILLTTRQPVPVCLAPADRNRALTAWMQTALNRMLKTRLLPVGIMGRDTRSALRHYQSHKRLRPSGLLNTATVRALLADEHELPAQLHCQALTSSVWTPPIRADELGTGRTDRLGSRTFDYGTFSIFIPAGAASVNTNHVHVFFSPGAVTGPSGSNAVAVHGLRSAADPSKWILISVPGVRGGFNKVSDAQIINCLRSVGRAPAIDAVRLSAYSRGAAGLAATLQGRLLMPSLIDHLTFLDVTDFAASLSRGLHSSHVAASRVTVYNVVFGAFPLTGVRNIGVPFACIRSIGYARLISDGVATGRSPSPLPSVIASRIGALTLPSGGSFSTATPTPPGKTNLGSFCADPGIGAALIAMRDGEPAKPTGVPSASQLSARASTSRYAFVEENNVMGFNSPTAPRAKWLHFSPQIYSHHLFVAEIASELFL